MLLFLPPLEYRLIYASLFPQARLAVCCLLSKSLKNLKELSSPWSLTATSPQLPPELRHQLLQDISSSQLPPASTDAWNKALGKPESCSRLFFRIWRVLVSWCSKAYLVCSLFWLLVPDPVWHSSLLAPTCAPGGPRGATCWTCCNFIAAGAPPCSSSCRACLPWEPALTPLCQQIQHSCCWLLSHRDIDLPPLAGEVTSSSGGREGPFHSLKIWGPKRAAGKRKPGCYSGLEPYFLISLCPGFFIHFLLLSVSKKWRYQVAWKCQMWAGMQRCLSSGSGCALPMGQLPIAFQSYPPLLVCRGSKDAWIGPCGFPSFAWVSRRGLLLQTWSTWPTLGVHLGERCITPPRVAVSLHCLSREPVDVEKQVRWLLSCHLLLKRDSWNI